MNEKPCVIRTEQLNHDGYVRRHIGGKKQMEHRYIWEQNNRMLQPGEVVRHTCDTPSCIEPSHLIVGTQADNVKDSVERGTHKQPSFKGEEHPMAKLTNEGMADMLSMFDEGYTRKEIALEFNLSYAYVCEAIRKQFLKDKI